MLVTTLDIYISLAFLYVLHSFVCMCIIYYIYIDQLGKYVQGIQLVFDILFTMS